VVYPVKVLALNAICTPYDSRNIPNEVVTFTVSINAGGIEVSEMNGWEFAVVSVTPAMLELLMVNEDPVSPAFPLTFINGLDALIFTVVTVSYLMETMTGPAALTA
jgi:hypothetical protein